MSKLALTLPWGNTGTTATVNANPAAKFQASIFNLADAINVFAEVAVFIGAFLMFFWMAWGVFDYIRAEGNKEALARARKRIQWAVAGFIILLISFFISDYLQNELLNSPSMTPKGPQHLQDLTRPQ